jgi:hypothetical protein
MGETPSCNRIVLEARGFRLFALAAALFLARRHLMGGRPEKAIRLLLWKYLSLEILVQK